MVKRGSVAISFPAWATALSIVSCYGTLALIGVLSLLGVSLAAEDRAWARAAVVFFAGLAAVALALSSAKRRRFAPLVLSVSGFLLISWATYGFRSRLVEAAGFALLAFVTAW
ncbi:MAG TPA: MerC family mercury resistance protein, partial [Roseiarcus sp.]|nr:MerC family mercury resistance protein [Roseiarcus sp.]